MSKFAHTNWLITGGCGFIGTNLISRLIEKDASTNIRVLDNLSVGTKEDLQEVCSFAEVPVAEIKQPPLGVELVTGCITDFESCLKSCLGIDVVVHLAANTGVTPSVEDPRQDMESNVIGTFNMLEASRLAGVQKFIFASSGAPVGEADPPIHEEKVPKPVSPYGASKLAGEGYCSAYYKSFGLKTISLRFGNAYGPRSKHKNSVVAKFVRQALNGETLEIYGDGNQTRDFIYLDDLIHAIELTANSAIGGEIFQISTERETTISEIANYIKKITENSERKQVDITFGEPRTGDVKRTYSDTSKARSILGFKPRFSLYEGLEKTFTYFIQRIQ